MNDDKKKTDELKEEELQKTKELSEEELDQIAGGTGDVYYDDRNGRQ